MLVCQYGIGMCFTVRRLLCIRSLAKRADCRVIALNGKIILIRPKQHLANELNYFEGRYFTEWARPREVQQYYLPRMIQKITGDTTVPFGDAIIATRDTVIGCETCEEAFVPDPPHVSAGPGQTMRVLKPSFVNEPS
jgi:predicted amidohydrolase